MSWPQPRRASAPQLATASAVIACCVLVFIAVRCLELDADTPQRISWHNARELFAEPPAKAHEARNYALFGAFHLNQADKYQFWRAQSPAWVYPLALFFRTFGVDYPQLRVFSTLYAALGLWALLALAARRVQVGAVAFVGVVLALDPVYFHYSRVGLLEPAVSAWLALSMLALVKAKERLPYLLLAHLAFIAAFFTKQAALLALPVLAIGTGIVLHASSRTSPTSERVLRRTIVGVLAVAAVLIAAYVSTDAYRRAVVHNVQHVLLGADDAAQHKWRGVASILFRLMDAERYGHLALSVPITGPMALITLALWLARAIRTRRIDFYELVTGLWLVCACFAMLVLAKSTLRFWTVVVPPAALVAAAGLDEALRALSQRYRPAAARLCLGIVLACVVALDLRGLSLTLADPRYTVHDAARAIEQRIGPRHATIVGFESPGTVLGTPYENYFVRTRINDDREALTGLGITHVLARDKREGTHKYFERELPGAWRDMKTVLRLRARNTRYRLLEVGDAIDARARALKEKSPAAPR